ncbi:MULTISPECIES: NUDIX domain-containing protein [unclassified Streptococcus]|uniref:NUDIX domain-containing protein n=1 Tax=unclassified Streptococcus TaxID=2608887 RepID=UPI0011B81827|nr:MULTISPECIES: NUDIX domain-containing protein [unclassified Streptococcus]TWT10412.1 NUDIX domain-containing protein [Streptococcus sp. sy004]TWT14771.1 NUDIX domain-containing protein [Streptococcus sp. sy010]
MTDYISFIRSKVGHDKVFLNFSVGILTDQAGRILLQKRSDFVGTWSLLGGCWELGESSIDALKREFMEESGIEIDVLELLNVYTNYEENYPNGDVAQTVGFLYRVKAVKDFDITGFTNEETLALNFFSEKDLSQIKIISPQQELMIKEYFTNSFGLGH